MAIRQKFKRILFLWRSAGLSPMEIILVAINKIIFFVSRWYFYFKNIITGEDPKVFYIYSRHLNGPAKGRALLAFLVEPIYKEHFLGKVKYYFSNNGAPLCVMRALNEMGYIVDVIDYRYFDFKPQDSYNLFFFHQYEIYDALIPKLNKNITTIEFETTAYWKPMVEKIRQRLEYFKQRHNVILPEGEYNHFLWMEQQQEVVDRVSLTSSGIIVMGDQLAGSFKQLASPQIKLIKSAVYKDTKFKKDLSLQNLEAGRKKFFFFGGGTDVMRKGLDILLDAIIGSEYELYMCINLPPLFEQTFQISKQKNIHNLGYLKVGSKKFYEVINSCNYIIQPSAAEGVPGGVLETMKYGLIPIVSKECNIPEAEKCGYLFPEVTVEEVKKALEVVSGPPVEILRQKALETVQAVATVYSPGTFTEDMKKGIMEIINAKRL